MVEAGRASAGWEPVAKKLVAAQAPPATTAPPATIAPRAMSRLRLSLSGAASIGPCSPRNSGPPGVMLMKVLLPRHAARYGRDPPQSGRAQPTHGSGWSTPAT